MKQRISVDDLKSLSPEQQEKLREWWKPSYGDCVFDKSDPTNKYDEGPLGNRINLDYINNNCLPLLSIGQCLELLEKEIDSLAPLLEYDWKLRLNGKGSIFRDELIDCLFEAVKLVL